MMQEGALAPLRLLRASFLLIKRLNLTVYLVSSNICIPAWIRPTAFDSVHRLDERQPLRNNWLIMGKQHHFTVKKNMAQINDGAVRQIKTHTLARGDEERDLIFSQLLQDACPK